MTNLDLFDMSIRDRERSSGEYPADFWPWLAANEVLYAGFVRIALQAKRAGFPRWGGRAVCERLRWESALRDGYANSVKVNNNAAAYLSRLAMAEVPELDGFFATREPGGSRGEAYRLDGTTYRPGHDDIGASL